jgi:shikimate kinase
MKPSGSDNAARAPGTMGTAGRRGAVHIVLVGLSGSGKSTVGVLLARRLGRPFVDTDALIEAEAGESIPRIFAGRGEPAFREIERRAVERAVAGPPAVIATGGGAPVDADNRAALWTGNLVVWLDAPVEELARRLGEQGSGRPLLAAGGPLARLRELRAAREAIYSLAHVRLDAARHTPQQLVDLVLERLHG